jgi:hypothetical protein
MQEASVEIDIRQVRSGVERFCLNSTDETRISSRTRSHR